MCRSLSVTRQGYYQHLKLLNKPYKHAALLAEIQALIKEDEFNDNYGRERIHDALLQRGWEISIPTIWRVCRKHGILPACKQNSPKGLTKQDKEAYKNDDALKGNFEADKPNKKLIGDITQLPTADGVLYIAGVFDCFYNACLGLSMQSNMRASMVLASIKMAVSNIRGAYGAKTIFHSGRGSQYTSCDFRNFIAKEKLTQSMSHTGSNCYGNAKCESIWARFKKEAIYGRYKTKDMSMGAVKSLIFRYFMGYWNNRRVCHAIGDLPPMLKRARFFESSAYNLPA